MKVFKPSKSVSLETISHSSKHLIAPGFTNRMSRDPIPPSIKSILFHSENELIEHFIVFPLVDRSDCLGFYFSLLLGTKTLIFHRFACLFHLHYHLLLLTLFLVSSVLLPVLKVREDIVVVHPNNPVLYLSVHIGLETSGVVSPMSKICKQALANHVTYDRARFHCAFGVHLVCVCFYHLIVLLQSDVHIITKGTLHDLMLFCFFVANHSVENSF